MIGRTISRMPTTKTPQEVHSIAGLDQFTDLELVGLVLESFPHHERCHINRARPGACTCKREAVLEAWARIVTRVKLAKS